MEKASVNKVQFSLIQYLQTVKSGAEHTRYNRKTFYSETQANNASGCHYEAVDKIINDPNSTQADIEFNTERLQIKLYELTLVDDEIHDFLNDQECSEDIIECEKYSENAHLQLFNSKKKANTSAAILPCSRIGSSPTPDSIHYASPPNITVKLPTVNINTFYGEIEEFHSFWERFENCIDKNESLSQIDKHMFLRGYLDMQKQKD
ncbi:DUF1758 domain-containing protein [Trichonephila clavata]|uniref:DUF1758 domain-containing protein n=1 Tax=Trichonephila clavata TaxID=2740835 RepID=A0A8X6K613_TRICU|nr:DUF1758 domain-containing protein [Trichonephila clavata]